MTAAEAEKPDMLPVAISARDRLAQIKSRHAPAHLIVDARSGTLLFLDGPIGPFLAPSSGAASLRLFDLLQEVLHDPVRDALRHAAFSRGATSRQVLMRQDETLAAALVHVEPLFPHDLTDADEDDEAEPCLFIIAFYPQPADTLPAGGPIIDLEPVRPFRERHRPSTAGPGSGADGTNPATATAQRELQAANDELRYLNAELIARNDRLLRSNEDFSTLLDSTLIATMFLDRELRVRSFTSNMTELFALRWPDVGRPITDLRSRLDYSDLEADVRQVLGSLQLLEREVRNNELEPRVFMMRMRPHRPPDAGPDGVVLTFVDITARKRAEDQAWFLAHHDQLTGLPNRAMFHAMLADGAAPPGPGDRVDARIGLLYLDLDLFKTVNDTFGHHVGDRLLQLVAGRLLAGVPEGAVVCRLGGDEFAIVQADVAKPDDLVTLAQSLLDAIPTPYEIDQHVVRIGVSIGIASSLRATLDVDRLTRAADLALYDAKARGRGNHSLFRPTMEAEWQRRRELERDLRDAIAHGQLALAYQPIVRLSDRRIVGAEALLRWQHPRHGAVPPASFIPIAEETGLIATIGIWVLRTACRDAVRWPEPLCLSVNLSPVQFASLDLVDTVRSALADAGLTPQRLILEVTETVLLHDTVRTQAVLAALRGAGVSIAMDDFGTGYSSLSYIRDFAVQKIKIDQAFIRTVDSQNASSVIVKAILAIGTGLDITVCAEGVETEAQLAVLQQWGVGEVQGFLLHRPMPPEALTRLLGPAVIQSCR